MTTKIRKLVSKKKKRLKIGEFDLDMAYITANILAMGFPSLNVEGMYRNKMSDVRKFLDTRHGEEYKVYNLCIEKDYDHANFYNRVGYYPFYDHNPPPVELFIPFCKSVERFINDTSEKALAAVHCKAGKGRTGVMICAWLLYSEYTKTPDEAFEFYAAMRTHNNKGLTIPSQMRFVRYFYSMLKEGGGHLPPMRSVTIKSLTIGKLNGIKVKKGAVKGSWVKILEGIFEKKCVYDSRKDATVATIDDDGMLKLELGKPLTLTAEYQIAFFFKGKKLFHTWHHTSFQKEKKIKLTKKDLDKIVKNKKYPDDFHMTIKFSEVDQRIHKSMISVDEDKPKFKYYAKELYYYDPHDPYSPKKKGDRITLKIPVDERYNKPKYLEGLLALELKYHAPGQDLTSSYENTETSSSSISSSEDSD